MSTPTQQPASTPASTALEVRVNGKPLTLPQGSTLRSLIEHLGMGKQAVAAEVNGSLVPWKKHAETPVSKGDVIELVSLVGGG
jgi:sulfur carrier protein